MINERYTEMFIAQAKEAGWHEDFINIVLKPECSLRIFARGHTDGDFRCDNCRHSIPAGDELVLQQNYDYLHLKCIHVLHCGNCNKELSHTKGDFAYSNEMFVCNDCTANMRNCADCNGLFLANELINGGYCMGCHVSCNRCAATVPRARTLNLRNGMTCQDCAGREIWVKPYNFNPLTLLTFHGNPKNGLFFGIELEIETADKAKVVHIAEDVSKSFGKYMVPKHDGSLADQGQRGLEIVTAPMSFELQKKVWKEFFDKGYEFASSNSDRCSTHIHMSKRGLRPMQLARMSHFMYSNSNLKLIATIAGRGLDNEWTRKYANINQKISMTDVAQVYGGDGYIKKQYGTNDKKLIDKLTLPINQRRLVFATAPNNRYSALNLANPETVEMRIFSGTNHYETMMKNLQFCMALIRYCDIAQTSYSRLNTPQDFVDFVVLNKSQYPELVKFLQERGLAAKPNKKPAPKQINLKGVYSPSV